MIRRFFIFVVLVAAAPGLAHGQSSPRSNNAPAARPHAASQQELDDYNAAAAAVGAAAQESAADDFAARYPASELRQYLYSKAMRSWQAENNAPRVLETARKVLALDPNHPVALVLTATVLADGLESKDADRARKVEEIKHAANRAIQSVNAGLLPPSDASPEQIALYRTTLLSMAHSALGMIELKTGNDAAAEKEFMVAAGFPQVRPDAYLWYHLALAQDHRKKYAAALSSVEQALQLASSNAELQKLAEIEHERLSGLARRGPHSQGATGMEPPRQ